MYQTLAKIDWKAFEYIHSANPREAFQKLAEQLFCYEFKQPYGVYRFYNQPYIETMPVHLENDYIGFQSKYYDASTLLSTKKGELIEAIDGAHSKYQGINRIVFYLNKEAGISTKPGTIRPSYIQEIENHGASKGIAVEWRGLNELETMLLHDENACLREYFFATDGGIKKELSQIQNHTNTILNSLSSEIHYHGQIIKISHSALTINSIWASHNNITIVYGDGGCGKSGAIKDLLESEKAYPIMVFKATDFNKANAFEFSRQFGDCTWDDVLSAFDDVSQKLFVVDSAEKVFFIEYQDTFISIINLLISHGWKLLFTIRTSYLANFINLILPKSDVDRIKIPKLSLEDLSRLEQTYAFSTPHNNKLKDLLCNPFYLNMYLSQENVTESQNDIDFLDRIWKQVIRRDAVQKDAINIKRELMICKIVRHIATSGLFYYIAKDPTEHDVLQSLYESEILQFDDSIGGYFITHDVYEELVLKVIISQEFKRNTTIADFFKAIGDQLLVRKSFRQWLHGKIDSSSESIEQFLSNTLQSDCIAPIWKDEILIVLLSENREVFVEHLNNILSEHNYALLIRGMQLLNTACKVVDDDFCRKIFTADELSKNIFFRYTKPDGIGWNYLIAFLYSHRESIPWSPILISSAVEAIDAWSRNNPTGETTRYAGLLALFLYPRIVGSQRAFHSDNNWNTKICDTVFACSNEINTEISIILNEIIAQEQVNHQDQYNVLCRHLLKDAFNVGKFCSVNPELVMRLAKIFWIDGNPSPYRYEHGVNIGIDFGLQQSLDNKYYPASAFQTPVFPLLQSSPTKTLNFIIELFDITTDAYKNSELNTHNAECIEIEIILPDGQTVKQIASDRLWMMHRGTSVAPDLLVSVLMALERWLYFEFQNVSNEIANEICFRLLSQSRSAAITAVVASMVLAYPNKLFDTACILVQTREIIQFDIARYTQERTAGFLSGLTPANKIYDDERKRSNNFPFRKKRLEEVILEYQLKSSEQSEEKHTAQITKLYASIDSAYPIEGDLPDYAKYALFRMDLRRMKLERGKDEAGHEIVAIVSDLPGNMLDAQKEKQEANQYDDKFLKLQLWSKARLEHNADQYTKYPQYENNPQTALEDGISFLENPCYVQVDNRFIIYIAAALICEFPDALEADTFDACCEIILTHIKHVIEEQSHCFAGDGTDAAIASLPALSGITTSDSITEDPMLLLFLLICDWGFQRDYAIKVFRENVWANPDMAHKLVSLFIQVKPYYDKEVSKYHGVSPFVFLERNASTVKDVLQQQSQPFPACNNLSSSAQISLCLLMPDIMDSDAYGIIFSTGEHLWQQMFAGNHFNRDDEWPGKYEQEYAYSEWLAIKLLQADATRRNQIITKISPYLSISDNFNHLLERLIFAQDKIKKTSAFWDVWNQLFPVIEALCVKKREHLIHARDDFYRGDLDSIVETFLLAFPYWEKNARSWHTLRQEDSGFYLKAVKSIGFYPSVLDSIAQILNSIGYRFEDQGIYWLSNIIKNNVHLSHCNLGINTLFNVEEYIQRYCKKNASKIKRDSETRNAVISILDFIIERGSTPGYMLREKYC